MVLKCRCSGRWCGPEAPLLCSQGRHAPSYKTLARNRTPFFLPLPLIQDLLQALHDSSIMVSRFAIVTLIFFFISTIFVIQPVSFHVQLPVLGRRKVTIGLMSAPILTIALLWAAQCLGATQIRDGIVGTGPSSPHAPRSSSL